MSPFRPLATGTLALSLSLAVRGESERLSASEGTADLLSLGVIWNL